jgi:nitroreductase
MLAAADTLIMATWLPNRGADATSLVSESQFAPTLANMEHLAAAAAAVQNLLLAATAHGLANYWSSGGVLRTDEVFDLLQIDRREILLGAIFLFPEKVPSGVEVVGSKLREQRTLPERWSRWVALA